MTGVGIDAAVHVVAAASAFAVVVWSLLWHGRRDVDVTHLRWAAWGTVVWCLCVVSVKVEGIHDWHQILWFPSVAFTSGALVLWAGGFAHYGWTPQRWLVATWLGVPALILLVRIAWGHDARVPLFVANTIYCFGALVIAAMWSSQRAWDASPTVRLVSRGLVVSAVGILIAEAFRANVTDLAVSLVVALLAVATTRAGEDLRGRPSPDTLIDDLGALLFVFDRDQRLVDLNAPARQFYSLRGVDPPVTGTAGRALLGHDLADLDAVFVELLVGAATVPLSGYVQRLPSHGSPPGGWVCLLRRSARPPSDEESRRARRDLMNRLPAHDPGTRVLSHGALERTLDHQSSAADAADVEVSALVLEAPGTALQAVARTVATTWEHRPECVAVGRHGPSRVALVVRDVSASVLRTWAEQGIRAPDVQVATRAGTLRDAPDLVQLAAGDLSRS
jgi:hypothetical protein